MNDFIQLNQAVDLQKAARMKEQLYAYRGVHSEHPALDEARQGIVYPGDRNGTVTPAEHARGGVSAESPYTSWTYDYDVASGFATDRGGGGVILRVRKDAPQSGQDWMWVESPNLNYWEEEVLLLGVRMDAEVVYGRSIRILAEGDRLESD